MLRQNHIPIVLQVHCHYPTFGSQMPGRTWVASDYRYSHNDQEKEDAVFKGAQSAEYWMYDSRIGRRWEMDPIKISSISPYSAFINNPITMSDPDGAFAEGGCYKR